MTKPFYWSVRREIWENRSVLAVPAIAAALLLVSFLARLPRFIEIPLPGDSLSRWCAMTLTILSFLAMFNGLFYSVDALHGERRDRSILFWKSMPVSDRVTVLSKIAIPLVVIPVITCITVLAVQLTMTLIGGAAVLLRGGQTLAMLDEVPWLSMTGELVTGLAVLALWQAPIYAWLLLVSGLARRGVLLWAALIPFCICLAEGLIFHSLTLANLILNRLTIGVLGSGLFEGHLVNPSWIDRLTQLTPGRIAADPNLWFGLLPSVLLLAGAIAARRYRQPL